MKRMLIGLAMLGLAGAACGTASADEPVQPRTETVTVAAPSPTVDENVTEIAEDGLELGTDDPDECIDRSAVLQGFRAASSYLNDGASQVQSYAFGQGAASIRRAADSYRDIGAGLPASEIGQVDNLHRIADLLDEAASALVAVRAPAFVDKFEAATELLRDLRLVPLVDEYPVC
jgi:hypothetical protein